MLIPLFEKVIIEKDKAPEQSGLILLPENARPRQMTGKVISVGPGKLLKDQSRRRMSVKKGDSVVFGEFAGITITHENKAYTILDQKEILAIIE